MNETEAQAFIERNVRVTHELVVRAKAYASQHFIAETPHLVEAFLREMEATHPGPIPLDTPEAENACKRLCYFLACQLAICEAIWSLVHANVFFPTDERLVDYPVHASYRTARVAGDLGPFLGFRAAVPRSLQIGSQLRSGHPDMFTDADLYLNHLNIADLHPLVDEALREAVRCFRYELYVPCLAMLAKAIEGAWTELGLALAAATPPVHVNRATKLRKELEDPYYSFARRLPKVRDYYADRDLCESVWSSSGVSKDAIIQVAIWADQVRDARNVVHYQAEAALPNTYEKVAALLMGAAPYLRQVYAALAAAKALAP